MFNLDNFIRNIVSDFKNILQLIIYYFVCFRLFYELETHTVPDHLVVLSRFKSAHLKHFDLVGSIKSFLMYLDYVNSLQQKTTKG